MAGNFSEQQIRPIKLTEKHRIAMLKDIGRLLSRYEEFVHVSCPACGADEASPKFEKYGINYVECIQCRTSYVSPRPTPDLLAWFYQGSANYAYWNDVVFPASEAARREHIFVPRVDRLLELCKKYAVGMDSILEVGAGFGTFCTEVKARNAFVRVMGIEPTPGLAETCRKRGVEIIELPIEQVCFDVPELFDVVASFEVIEHIYAPQDFVAHAVKLLKPGGLLIMTCPNGQGFDIQTLGAASNTVDHEHLNYFNPDSLSGLLARCGLEVLESFTPGRLDAELVRNKVLAGEHDISAQPFLKRVLIDEWERLGQPFQDFLAQQGLSSNMWLVARKL